MPFSVFEEGLVWPAELSAAKLKAADKKNQCEEIVASLRDAEKLCIATGNKIEFPPRKAEQGKANEWVVWAQKFAAGSELKKFTGSLKIIKARVDNLIKAAADKKNKSVKLEKKLDPILKAIAASAQEHADSLDRKKLVVQIGALGKAAMAAEKASALKMIGPTSVAMKKCAAKGHPGVKKAAGAMKNWSDDDLEAQDQVRKQVGNELRNDCRDMTQCLSNFLKALKHGGDVPGLQERDVKALPKLAKTLVPYANSQTGSDFTGGLKKGELATLIKTINANAKLFDQIASHLP